MQQEDAELTSPDEHIETTTIYRATLPENDLKTREWLFHNQYCNERTRWSLTGGKKKRSTQDPQPQWATQKGLEVSQALCHSLTSDYTTVIRMVVAQKGTHRPMEQNREPEINPGTQGQLIHDTGGSEEKLAFSITDVETTGQQHVKE